ncbi:acyltransferase [Nocardioides guangzhouensis]|uniref:Acyltransferase n=1 Tax=Nocardioides guangzhouensis TaxID=2497878 RepID=A0A4Q4ZAI4_9ACTN|nr:acyltransferase [Nocardioides guangzhouensis]RYP84947.1 acyltransferase [Nocardioides guangzhouensis]
MTAIDEREPTVRSFPTLNAVRAVGAIMVVLTHCAFNTGKVVDGWFGGVLSRFDFGVTLFFILSGFLLTRPFLLSSALGQGGPSVTHYLWKRALRILPLYWTVVVVAMTLDPANDDATRRDWVAQLTLTQIYRPELLASSLTQMWSLCTEVAFYLLLPVLVLGLVGRRFSLPRILVTLGVLSVLGVAWQTAAATWPAEWHLSQWLPGYVPWFAIGVAFAAMSADHVARPRLRPSRLDRLGSDLTGCWILATAVFALACTDVAGPRTLIPATPWESLAKCVLYAIAGTFFVLPLVFGPERAGRVRTFMASPVPFFLGDISFGIFAIHMFVLVQGMRLLDIEVFTGHFWGVLALVLSVTIVVSTVSFYVLERPFLRLKNSGPFAKSAAAATETAPMASS